MSVHSNVEVEQNILGALLVNNDVFQTIAGRITADDFFDPVHRRLYERIAAQLAQDALVSPVTLKVAFEDDEGLKELGGPKYLARLAGAAISIFATRDYADTLAALGRKRRLAERLEEEIEALKDPDKDAAAVLGSIEAYSMLQEGKAGAEIVPFARALMTAVEDTQRAFENDELPGAPTGIRNLDLMTGGFFPGELVILGGRPAMGKSATALAMALNAARAGKGVAIASLEMTAASLALRAISEATSRTGAGVAYNDARRGGISDDDCRAFFESARDISGLPIHIIPSTVRDLGAIYAMAKRSARMLEAKGTPLSMLIVDYLQLIRSAKQSRYDQISEISMGLKALAMQLGVPIVALSQLSRSVESRDDKRPVMSDLRESGQLEQDADVILFCYRDEYYLQREKPEEHDCDAVQEWHQALSRAAGFMDIIVAKQRMGETGNVRVRFDARTNAIRDLGAA